jgi:hypothetical protein
MIQRPRLKTYLTIFPLSETTWGLRGGFEEHWKIKLNDEQSVRVFSSLLPYLSGQHAVEDILSKVGAQGGDQNIARQMLEHLEASSFIEDADGSNLSPEEELQFCDQITFFSRFTSDGGAKCQSRLMETRIGLVGDGTLSRSVRRHLNITGFGEIVVLEDNPADVLRAADGDQGSPPQRDARLTFHTLDRKSIWPADAGPVPELFIVPQESHDPQLLGAMDAFSKEHNVAWLLLRLVNPHEGWVGPLFIPGDTASYLSLEARLRGNIPFFDEYQAFDNYLRAAEKPSAVCGGLHTFFELLSGVAVTELAKFVSGLAIPHLAGRFMSVNMMTWDTEVHEVLRVPHLEKAHESPRVFPWKDVPYGDKKTRRA